MALDSRKQYWAKSHRHALVSYIIYMQCERCGGVTWRVTSSGLLDDLRNAFGDVSYKCLRCGYRIRRREWPLREFVYVHCPRCFSQDVQRWNPAFLPHSLRRSIMLALGAGSYRCYQCQHCFTSTRMRKRFERRHQSEHSHEDATDGTQAENHRSDREYMS